MLRRILKDTSIYGIGRVLTQVIGLVLLPIYTSYLSPDEFGLIATYEVIAGLLLLIMILSSEQVIPRLYSAYTEAQRREMLGTLVVISLGLSLALFVASLLIGKEVYSLIFTSEASRTHAFLIPWVVLSTTFMMPFSYLQIILRMEQRPTQAMLMNFLLVVLIGIATVTLLTVARYGLQGYVFGQLLGTACIGLVSLFLVLKHIKIHFSFSQAKQAVLNSIAPLSHSLIVALGQSMDRILLERLVPIGMLGQYMVASRVGTSLFGLPSFAASYGMQPYLFKEAAKVPEAFADAFRITQIGMFTLAVFVAAAAGPILKVVTTPPFHGLAALVSLFVLAQFVKYIWTTYSNKLVYLEQVGKLPYISLASVLGGITAIFMLSQAFGVGGAAAGLAVMQLIKVFLGWSFSRSKDMTFWDDRLLFYSIGFLGSAIVIMGMVSPTMKFVVAAAAGLAFAVLALIKPTKASKDRGLVFPGGIFKDTRSPVFCTPTKSTHEKHIFIGIPMAAGVRDVLRTDVFQVLKERRVHIHIFYAGAYDPDFQKELGGTNVEFHEFRPNPRRAYEIIDRLSHKLQLFLLGLYCDTLQTLLKPVISKRWHLKILARLLLLLDDRLVVGLMKGISKVSSLFAPNLYADLFEQYKPALVIGTRVFNIGHRYLDRFLVLGAMKAGIPTLIIIPSWDNLTSKGFIPPYVNYVTVWNEIMKREAMLYH